MALAGDTVEIAAGIYTSDVARWASNNLLLKGVGGMAHLKSNGNSYGGKAIWVIAGNNIQIENIEFSLCSVPDHNGAGIRQEGLNLTVKHCYFHHNENGILAGTLNPSKIIIEYSEFAYNGYGDGQTHNLYINNIDTLLFQFNYSHHAYIGHELKSRARVNYILYNRISDENTGTASRNIDLPNGGTSYIIGNIIEQGPQSPNSNLIGYGLEGLINPTPNELYAINNTMINNRSTGSFFQLVSGSSLFKAYNNIMAGTGSFNIGVWPVVVDTASNLLVNSISLVGFKDAATYDFHLLNTSGSCINKGVNPGIKNGFSLSPVQEYLHPNTSSPRCLSGVLDLGAFEYCSQVFVDESNPADFQVFPNPVSDFLTVVSTYNSPTYLEIFNLKGQLVLSDNNTRLMDLTDLPKGLYLLKIVQGNSMAFKKIMKL